MIDRAPHFLLDCQAGWRAGSLDKTGFVRGELRLQPMPGAMRPLMDGTGSLGGLQNPEGLAVDSEDRVYILDAAACVVKRFDRCSRQFATLPCIGPCGSAPRKLSTPHGLAISCGDNIYIADTGNRRVQIFSVKGLALRQIWEPLLVTRTPAGIGVKPAKPVAGPAPAPGCECRVAYPEGTWQPWDVAVTSRNWAFVSDYANGLIHVFDPRGCWRTSYTGQGPSTPQFVKPTRLAVDAKGHLYVIQENLDYVVILDLDGKFLGTVKQPDEISGRFCPVAVAVDVNGNLCLSDCLTQQVYFYQPDGDGGWCPFRCCGATASFATSMIYDRCGNALFAAGSGGICQLSPQASYPLSGTFYSAPLDSKTYRCVWDRILLVGTVPAGAAIKVDTFTAESEKSSDEIAGLPESRWSTRQLHADTTSREWDCLIQAPPGRYLWLRLTLVGDGSASPEISRAKIYYPRSSSLKYLPAVYRADPVSGDFLDRFLSIFDTLRRSPSGAITDIAGFFDPKATPANRRNAGGSDFLSWLASWLGMTLKTGWPVAMRRRLLENAHRLYALRGTPEGLRLHIQLYAGVQPRILELFRLRRWFSVDHSTLGNDTTLAGNSALNRLQVGVNSTIGSFQLVDFGDPKLDLFNKYAYRFLVVVPRWPGAGPADQEAIRQIIETAKPAHTVGEFQWSEPRLQVGLQSYVGIDTVIAKYPEGAIEGQGKLGYDTVLGNPSEDRAGPSMRVGRQSVIGCNSTLT